MLFSQLLVSRLEFCDQPRLPLRALLLLLNFTPSPYESLTQPLSLNCQPRSSENDQ